ncbi:MAG: class I SAM-dependent methyltransferase [Patescibacteria group bacterium]|nr:class I SAM-dependent methyltransferase [Patescibacteria group bacterium]
MNHKTKGIRQYIKKLLQFVGLYQFLKFLIDYGLFERKKYCSTLFRADTSSFFIRRYHGYQGHKADSKTGNLGYGAIHYSLINITNPERVLCVGSYKGFIPAICTLACRDNNRGMVDFVDAGYDSEDENDWGGEGVWRECNPVEYFKPFHLDKYLKLHVMKSDEFAKKFPEKKFEYIYIDGDHSYEGVKADFEAFWPKLTEGGLILFHDIAMKGLHHGKEFGVWKLWQELSDKNQFSFINGYESLGIIQKN